MKIKTSDLIGPALDWTVAKCQGLRINYDGIAYWVSAPDLSSPIGPRWKSGGRPCGYSPSTIWAFGGPILERERIFVGPKEYPDETSPFRAAKYDHAFFYEYGEEYGQFVGPTPLIAAMRCYVASKLGDVVEVPDELL